VAAVCAVLAVPSVRAAAVRPNVIVILADDLGYADIGAQGVSKDVRTPNIDSIAKNGVRFTNGYVSCPVCSPSRAGLLTGRYGERFGYELNPGGVNWPNFGLPADQPTLAEVLRPAGYHTGALGKWHLGNIRERAPLARGFDEFFGFWGGMHSYMNLKKIPPGWNAIRRGDEKVSETEYLTDAIGREGAAFIDRNHDKPFFLYAAFNAIHQPMQAPAKYQDRFKEVKDEKRRKMLAMLSAEDDAVGGILAKLREYGIEGNTMVFFLSDNGGPTEGNASANKPFSGYKSQLFEGGIREPFFVQWKGHIPAGQVRDEPVISLDIFATAVRESGAEVRKDRPLDGVDLMPWLEGKSEARPHDVLYWRYSPQWAIREGDWKLIGLKDHVKLFNLAEDVGEKKDLAAERPDVVKRLRAAYASWDQELAEPMWHSDPAWDMDEQEFNSQEDPHVAHARRTAGKPKAAGGDSE
jgi:arylsulfatase A-like enzyme